LPFKAKSLPSNAPALSLWTTTNMLQAQADIIIADQQLLKDQEGRDFDLDRMLHEFIHVLRTILMF